MNDSCVQSLHVRTRPEEQGPADAFYNETEAHKYLHSSRMIEVQTPMATSLDEGKSTAVAPSMSRHDAARSTIDWRASSTKLKSSAAFASFL